jgi:HD-GYP domain-containing protein (c-di-GMP phosphodiesterase class II)
MASRHRLYAAAAIRAAAVSVALDERDAATHDHCDRVSGLSIEPGAACRLSARELQQLALAGAFHDVGKIGIPDTVLKKPGELTGAEWELMKTHSARGERIVLAAELDDSAEVAAAVRQHHERMDGGGYPDGLAGEQISVLARIVAIADTYDAMARSRMYGQPRTHVEIMAELLGEQDRQHDAYFIERFAAVIEHSRFRVA